MKHRTIIIAEIGTSHGGNLDKAKELVKAASEAGADCLKFQWVYADEILHPKSGYVTLPTGNIALYERFKQLEVSSSFFSEVKDYVHSLGKKFMCSPFGEKSLTELFNIKPDYIKIASPELNHIPLLQMLLKLEMSQNNKERIPIILSSGVSTMQDIKTALDVLTPLTYHNLVSLLHCVTSYPAPIEDYNLNLIEYYIKELNIPIGVSDHTKDPIVVPTLTLACGGSIIEKHITLSNDTEGLDDPVALNPENFNKMVQSIRRFEQTEKNSIIDSLQQTYGKDTIIKCLGSGEKVLAKSEQDNYGRTNRSIHFMRNMREGEIITPNDIAVLRTEKELSVGIEPIHLNTVVGKKIIQNVKDGDGLQWEHIQ